MLKSLSIRNYALIDKLEMDFHSGLSTLTGETGAGKSVIIGALALLSGRRADASRLRDKQQKAVIEAEFDTSDIQHLKSIFEESDIDWADEGLIIRREIAPDGRSRIFINDTPVSLKQLSAIGPSIIDIHSQHSNQMLEDEDYRLRILDLMGENDTALSIYKEAFDSYVSFRNKLRTAKAKQEETRSRLEVYKLQLERLRKIAPKPGELQALERELEILSNAEVISANMTEATVSLWQGDVTALSLLDKAKAALNKVGSEYIATTADEGKELLQRIDSIYLELKDISDAISRSSAEIADNPARLEKVQNRIESYYETMALTKTQEPDRLVDMMRDLEQQIKLADDNDIIETLEKQTALAAAKLKEAAKSLTDRRVKAAAELARQIEDTARPLGMANLRFTIEVNACKLSAHGGDTVEFMCSFNKNVALMPVQKVASGGEVSRLMLAIKSLTAAKLQIPVLVFDEVDTGVSGEIADKMGKMMARIAQKIQVIAITHLPQVAALGQRQYLVSKADNEHTTLTSIRLLSPEERVEELARMLSGESINDAARQNARSLLGG